MFRIDQTFGDVNPLLKQVPDNFQIPAPPAEGDPAPPPAFPVTPPANDVPPIVDTTKPPIDTQTTPPAVQPNPANPTPAPTPDPNNPDPNPPISEQSTFYLLSQALKEKGIFPEDFPLDTTADAAKYVEATAQYLNKTKEQIRQEEALALQEQYQDAYEDIQYVLNGGKPETIAALRPVEQLANLDIAQVPEEQKVDVKQGILAQALYLEGTRDTDVINYAIKGFIENGTFDTKVAEAQAYLQNYVTQYKEYEIQQAQAAKEAERLRAEKEAQQYTAGIKNAIQERLVKGLNMDANATKAFEEKIFGKRTELVEIMTADNKVQKVAMTPWEKFITEFHNNPEVQLISFYNYINGASGVQALQQTMQRKVTGDLFAELNQRNQLTQTIEPGGMPSMEGATPMHKIR